MFEYSIERCLQTDSFVIGYDNEKLVYLKKSTELIIV